MNNSNHNLEKSTKNYIKHSNIISNQRILNFSSVSSDSDDKNSVYVGKRVDWHRDLSDEWHILGELSQTFQELMYPFSSRYYHQACPLFQANLSSLTIAPHRYQSLTTSGAYNSHLDMVMHLKALILLK